MRFIRIDWAFRASSVLLLVLISICGQASAASLGAPPSGTTSPLTAVLVRFRDATTIDTSPSVLQQQELRRSGAGGAVESLGEPGLFRAVVTGGFNAQDAAAALQRDPDVLYAEPDRTIHSGDPIARYASAAPASSDVSNSWALDAIEASRAWSMGTGTGVVVAVLDTGVSASHPDLAGRVLPGWNFVQNNADTADDDGHGTFVAGLIAGTSESEREGVAPGASILPVKILDKSGVGSTASFVAGINYAVNSGARIINISASGASDSAALNDALTYAESHGVLVVASAGNDANEQTPYPAAVSTVLAVSATDQQNKLASFSSFGPYVDLAAPGVDIWSTWWSASSGNGHAIASGSSASAPLVAGVAAIVAGLRPDASPSLLREIVTESALDIEATGIDAQTGYGLVDAFAAARIAEPPPADGTASISAVQSGDGEHFSLTSNGFSPNEPITLWTSSSVGYTLNRTMRAGQSGDLLADLGPAWHFPQGTVIAYAIGADSGRAVTARFDVTAQPAIDPFRPVSPVPSTSDRTFFPETGHTLAYGFKQFWESNGGLAVFGYPISEEFSETNSDTGQTYTVQYFERYRFEYHPEFAGTPAEVSLGRLGVQTSLQTFPVAPPPSDSSVLYFSATQHTLTGVFRSYWESHGGVPIFGYPTSEPFEQGGLLVQYFERARFELHPDLPAGYRVLLSRLGVAIAREDGYLR